ncbi:MAG TPA: M20/M25/M40 family metallo-hydrolase [Steroidobacteraceae bacterium]|nr:M20/M25/M40 family metallo-hydrolase [Steroidobacteraceae bacterium]
MGARHLRLIATLPAALIACAAATCWLPCKAASVTAAERGSAAGDAAADALARDILKQLIEINTTNSVGNVTTAAEAMAQRFLGAGFAPADVVIAGPEERKKNLVMRLHGAGRHKPVLLIGHLDVVEARREDWSTDPFELIEKDGYFYGRGSADMKDGDAIMATALLRMKQEGYRPSRDIVLALTADEEGGCCNGPQWLLSHRRDLIDAEFVLNHDGASVVSEHGVPQIFRLAATQKVYADYQLTVTNPGGHSSLPRPDNAIYQLAAGLLRIGHYQFPFELNTVTRAYFERMAAISTGDTAADMRAVAGATPDPQAMERLAREPSYGSLMRTTCVATRLDGGHANNALPQRAEAVVNCRILPGHSPEDVRGDLTRIIDDPQIAVHFIADNGEISDTAPERRGFPPPPLMPQVVQPLERVVAATWPGIPVIPVMIAGASDAVHTSAAGLPTYGVSGIAVDRDDVRMHGRDERVRVAAFYTGNRFFYRYLKALTAH